MAAVEDAVGRGENRAYVLRYAMLQHPRELRGDATSSAVALRGYAMAVRGADNILPWNVRSRVLGVRLASSPSVDYH